jgi:Mor family transcriptional regulator
MQREVPSKRFIEISRKIGFDATIALCRQYGGKRVYIPKLFTGLKAKRDSLILEQYKLLGHSTRQLSHRWGLTQRRIQQILRKQGEASPTSHIDTTSRPA